MHMSPASAWAGSSSLALQIEVTTWQYMLGPILYPPGAVVMHGCQDSVVVGPIFDVLPMHKRGCQPLKEPPHF